MTTPTEDPDDARKKVDELEEQHVSIPEGDARRPVVEPSSATESDRDEQDPASADAGASEPPD